MFFVSCVFSLWWYIRHIECQPNPPLTVQQDSLNLPGYMLDPFMTVAPKKQTMPDYFGSISLTKAIFRKYLKEKC